MMRLHALLSLAFLCVPRPTVAFSAISPLLLTDPVVVWDNVVPPKTCEVLHEAASQAGLGHRAFTRGSATSSPIELCINKILDEMGDDQGQGGEQFVEYWTRQEWRHIEAHADVDEYKAMAQDKESEAGEYRYPTNAHVLYLQVGSEVRGPTCVFPGRSSGGELLLSKSEGEEVPLVTVPAVPGRLLRFQGDFLHAVPRPTDLWFLSFVKGSPQFDPAEEWGRSVILFNTWHGRPPLDVPLDEFSPKKDEGDSEPPPAIQTSNDWRAAYSSDQSSPASETDDEAPSSRAAKIWLLGNLRRREHSLRTLKLQPKHGDSVKDALFEGQKVSQVALTNCPQ